MCFKTTAGGSCSFEIISDECEYIFNNRLDLETVLTFSPLVWPQLLLLFHVLFHWAIKAYLICRWCVWTHKLVSSAVFH